MLSPYLLKRSNNDRPKKKKPEMPTVYKSKGGHCHKPDNHNSSINDMNLD